MHKLRYLYWVLSILLIFSEAEAQESLPRSLPEAQGVSSAEILKFVQAADAHPFEFHSFMVVRHGKVIAEGWWDPYHEELKHSMYSVTKSFTSTAVGFAVAEGLLSVNDTVIKFFPEHLPEIISENLSKLTVKHLLTMTTGQERSASVSDSNWIQAFFKEPIIYDPGTKYYYNSMGSHMLSEIVQKVSGQKISDYLLPRLFKPLGIKDYDWLMTPGFVNTGGWGLRLRTEDMAKFGQLLLNNGDWKGQQVLSSEWINEATGRQVYSWPAWLPEGTSMDSSDWNQGYGYQFWRNRGNSYRADGAFGQLIIVLPEQDAVIAITAGGQLMQDEINLIWKYLMPAFNDGKLKRSNTTSKALKKQSKTLKLPVPAKSWKGSTTVKFAGKQYNFKDKEIQSVQFNFDDQERIELILTTDSRTSTLNFGNGTWLKGNTDKTAPDLAGLPKTLDKGNKQVKYAGAFTWKDERTLEMILRYIETPFYEKYTFRFKGDSINLQISGNLNGEGVIKEIQGDSLNR